MYGWMGQGWDNILHVVCVTSVNNFSSSGPAKLRCLFLVYLGVPHQELFCTEWRGWVEVLHIHRVN